VDFLHRTVRDFLQDNYYSQLHVNLKGQFGSMPALCRIFLVMLKSLPNVDFKAAPSINKVFGLTDELLYYAYETEQMDQNPVSSLVDVLDEVDRVNTHYAHGARNHWTHARDEVGELGLDVYREGGKYNFLALTVQARLVKYVRAKLDANPKNLRKGGRPLLDYALRPRRITPMSMSYHSKRDDPSVNVDMVRLLLERGADPNQPVHLNDSKSVWYLFLLSMHETVNRVRVGNTRPSTSLTSAWYQSCELLIHHGARKNSYEFEGGEERADYGIFLHLFGSAKADALVALMNEKEREGQQGKGSCMIM